MAKWTLTDLKLLKDIQERVELYAKEVDNLTNGEALSAEVVAAMKEDGFWDENGEWIYTEETSVS